MSGLLEHFKPPPLASDPPAKTRYYPAPPKGDKGGILQRPAPSVSSSSSRVSFAPLPDVALRKRRNSITLGVAARSAALRRIKEAGPQQAARPPPGPPRPRPRRPPGYKDDQVVDLGEVAMDAGKKLWRVVSQKKTHKGAASESGLPRGDPHAVGGPTVGAIGHNTEREISVRGFALPEEEEDGEEDGEEDDDEDDDEEIQHRTEDYVAGMQAMHISDSPESGKSPEMHSQLSPPPLFRSEASDVGSSSVSNVSTPSQQESPPVQPAELGKDIF